ncbi:MAG: pyrroline-5-carboxylate reductase [Chthonomonas sp.]|nr:pyrroline-5-carboxylate reductase [Chthonomonas sp.]
MLSSSKIAIVGSGQMAEAVLGGLLSQGSIAPYQVIGSGPRASRGDKLAAQYGIRTTTDNRAAVEGADIVLLGIKPQMAAPVLPELAPVIKRDALVVSIAAGITLATLSEGLGHPAVVRAMPNTPGKINAGITVWTCSEAVTEVQKRQAAALLSALGDEVFVEHERYIDMATALSGTGPMYVLLFMESLVDAGVRMGLPRYLAERLVLQTVKGSAEYAQLTGHHLAQLRNDVTSPGGTSAEALHELDRAGFRPAIGNAVMAAFRRSVELGEPKR